MLLELLDRSVPPSRQADASAWRGWQRFSSSVGRGRCKGRRPAVAGVRRTRTTISRSAPTGLTAHWAPDFTNPANQKFMAEFEKEYKRVPTLYASQGYDAASRRRRSA